MSTRLDEKGRRMLRWFVVALVLALGGFVTALILVPRPQADGCAKPHDAPALRPASSGYQVKVERAFQADFETVTQAVFDTRLGLRSYRQPTQSVPLVRGSIQLLGAYPDQGSVRQLLFETGDCAVEGVRIKLPNALVVQQWNHTTNFGTLFEYATFSIGVSPLSPGETLVTWAADAHPRYQGLEFLVRQGIEEDLKGALEAGMDSFQADFVRNSQR